MIKEARDSSKGSNRTELSAVEMLVVHLSPAAQAEQFLTLFSRLSPEVLKDLEVEATAITGERYWEFDAAWELVRAAGGRRTMASALATAEEMGVTTGLQAIAAAAAGAVRVRPDIPRDTFAFLYEPFAKLFLVSQPAVDAKQSFWSVVASRLCCDRRRPFPVTVAMPRGGPEDAAEWRLRTLRSGD